MSGVGLGIDLTIEVGSSVKVAGDVLIILAVGIGETIGTTIILVDGVVPGDACVPRPGAPQATKKAHNRNRVQVLFSK